MDTLTFLAKLAWPVVGLILGALALCMFKRPITEMLGRMARAKVPGGTELTFNPQDAASEDPETRALADRKQAALERSAEQRLERLLQQQADTSQALAGVMAVVKEGFSASRRVDEEAREETVAGDILRALRTAHGPLTINEIAGSMVAERGQALTPEESVDFFRALTDMESRGIVRLSTSGFRSSTVVSLVNK